MTPAERLAEIRERHAAQPGCLFCTVTIDADGEVEHEETCTGNEVVLLRGQVAALQATLAVVREKLEQIERSCPCGARPESPSTHLHVGGCPVYEALAALEGGR